MKGLFLLFTFCLLAMISKAQEFKTSNEPVLASKSSSHKLVNSTVKVDDKVYKISYRTEEEHIKKLAAIAKVNGFALGACDCVVSVVGNGSCVTTCCYSTGPSVICDQTSSDCCNLPQTLCP